MCGQPASARGSTPVVCLDEVRDGKEKPRKSVEQPRYRSNITMFTANVPDVRMPVRATGGATRGGVTTPSEGVVDQHASVHERRRTPSQWAWGPSGHRARRPGDPARDRGCSDPRARRRPPGRGHPPGDPRVPLISDAAPWGFGADRDEQVARHIVVTRHLFVLSRVVRAQGAVGWLPPKRRSRCTYVSTAAHRSRRSKSGQSRSRKIISA